MELSLYFSPLATLHVYVKCRINSIRLTIISFFYAFFSFHIHQDQSSRNSTNILTKKSPGGILGSMIGSRQNSSQAVITIDPKIFFANERTFLAWLHTSVLLAGASIAINSFSHADRLSQLYGVALLPISVAFMLYSMSQCEFILPLNNNNYS